MNCGQYIKSLVFLCSLLSGFLRTVCAHFCFWKENIPPCTDLQARRALRFWPDCIVFGESLSANADVAVR